MTPDLTFAIPGDLQTLTGGYGYDRRLIAGLQALGLSVAHMPLSGTFPVPDAAALADAESRFATLPDGAIVIADGLAFGVMEEIVERHGARLQIIALCHHPLALEAGLSAAEAQRLQLSEQRALQAARAVLVTSTPTANLLTQQFSISESKITVALPGTDRQHFAPCTGNPPMLLTVATLTPRKAHDVLIEALAQISDLPWSARFVGGMEFDPAWATALQHKVHACGLQQRIHFLGGLTALEHEYDGADLFVLPSLFEGYGMAFAEALAHGLPVVAARAGAVPDVVPESAGILVPPGDVQALAEALRRLLTEPALRQSLQLGAQQAAARLPTWTDTARIVANLINRIRTASQQQSSQEQE
ncbi:MAG: glycosyltransferase family 4 protein [Gammaproteobacteria bacterium]|nr:glycosyltransferase family 4 protein [Gammaproteobacteria bacterium]